MTRVGREPVACDPGPWTLMGHGSWAVNFWGEPRLTWANLTSGKMKIINKWIKYSFLPRGRVGPERSTYICLRYVFVPAHELVHVNLAWTPAHMSQLGSQIHQSSWTLAHTAHERFTANPSEQWLGLFRKASNEALSSICACFPSS